MLSFSNEIDPFFSAAHIYFSNMDVAVGVVKLFGLCCVPILVCLIFVFVEK